MIKLYLIVLILIFLTILLSNKESFNSKCNVNDLLSEPLLINGGLINDKIHIFWNKPYGLEGVNDSTINYDVIYSTNNSNVTTPIEHDNNIFEKIPSSDVKPTKDKNLYSYIFPNMPLEYGEYYYITLNMNININDESKAQTLSSNTLIINKTSNDNPIINYLSNPNDIFANLKNKSIDIII